MRVLIEGVVIGSGKSAAKDGTPIFWVKLYQENGNQRPGETADVWTREALECKVGQAVSIQASVRADGDRLRITGAELVEVE